MNLTAAGAGAVLGVGAVKKFGSYKEQQQVKKAGGTQQQINLAGKNSKTSGAAQAAGAVAGGAVGLGVSWLAQKVGPDILKPDQSYRISDVITLAVQEPPSVTYSAKWNNTELGTIFGALGKTAGALEQGRAAGLATAAAVLGLSTLAGAAIGAKLQGVAGGAI